MSEDMVAYNVIELCRLTYLDHGLVRVCQLKDGWARFDIAVRMLSHSGSKYCTF